MQACLDETLKLKEEFELAQARVALQNELTMNRKFVINPACRPQKTKPLNLERECSQSVGMGNLSRMYEA